MALASLRACGGVSTSGRFGGPTSSIRVPSVAHGRVVVRAALAPVEAHPGLKGQGAEYAVISTPVGLELVEEGKWFALCRDTIEQLPSADGRLRFSPVSVKRADGEFVKGKPFLSDWVVEAELLDEQAFAVQSAASKEQQRLLGKVLVTRIAHSEEQRRLLEEAFRV